MAYSLHQFEKQVFFESGRSICAVMATPLP